uniref:Ubiquitin-like protease family profile domain-containing protein n=1 Tax=Percolomonas cosmopolitus TaxID=63605 RepID=A0A7S1KUU3_9EUKA|eukprot:CAMPEP_0117446882 /NCGR_PEP_ID=MMETSP0759-20121206/6579_1 /TAXON_ID=63605 /ORGANISM="Percolomonas cosmopolitus, Strain WS" /LENGTH=1437 /DNA_ID=CAMNT_0005239181 /DNA_START=151 /DNA_END=4464 /DNA_ORIENTATION=-
MSRTPDTPLSVPSNGSRNGLRKITLKPPNVMRQASERQQPVPAASDEQEDAAHALVSQPNDVETPDSARTSASIVPPLLSSNNPLGRLSVDRWMASSTPRNRTNSPNVTPGSPMMPPRMSPPMDDSTLSDMKLPVAQHAPFQRQYLSEFRNQCEKITLRENPFVEMHGAFLGIDMGTSSTVVTLYERRKGITWIEYKSQRYEPTVVFLPDSACRNGEVSLTKLLFGHAALQKAALIPGSKNLLSHWKPFIQADTKEEFSSLLETYRDTGFHTSLAWSDHLGPCFRFVSQDGTVTKDFSLHDVEHQILARYLEKVNNEEESIVQHAVFAMPVYTPMSVRQRRRQALYTAFAGKVKQWTVLTESACAFIATLHGFETVEPSNMIVVDLGEGTLDISIGCCNSSCAFEFWNHTGNTAINGFAFTIAVFNRIWRVLDAGVVQDDDTVDMEVVRQRYSVTFIQHLLSCAQSIKEDIASTMDESVTVETKTFLCAHHELTGDAWQRMKTFIRHTPHWTYTKEAFVQDTQQLTNHLIALIEQCIAKAPESNPVDTVICVGRSWKNAELTNAVKSHFRPKYSVFTTDLDASVSTGAAKSAVLVEHDAVHRGDRIGDRLDTNIYLEMTNPKLDTDPNAAPLVLELVLKKGTKIPLQEPVRWDTERCSESHMEVDYPIYTGDSEANARLMCAFVVPAYHKHGYIQFTMDVGGKITVKSAHGGKDPVELQLQYSSLYEGIKFDAHYQEQYFAPEGVQEIPLEDVTHKRKRDVLTADIPLPPLESEDMSDSPDEPESTLPHPKRRRRVSAYKPQSALYHLRRNQSKVKTVICLNHNHLEETASPDTCLPREVVDLGMDVYQANAKTTTGCIVTSSEFMQQLMTGKKVPFHLHGQSQLQTVSREIRDNSVLLVPVFNEALMYWFLFVADMRTLETVHPDLTKEKVFRNRLVCHTVSLSGSARRKRAKCYEDKCMKRLAHFLKGLRDLRETFERFEHHGTRGDSGICVLARIQSITQRVFHDNSPRIFSLSRTQVQHWRQRWVELLAEVEDGSNLLRRRLDEVYLSLYTHTNEESSDSDEEADSTHSSDEESGDSDKRANSSHSSNDTTSATSDDNQNDADTAMTDHMEVDNEPNDDDGTHINLTQEPPSSPSAVIIDDDRECLYELHSRDSVLRTGVHITREQFRNVATPNMWVQQDILQLFLEFLQRKYSDNLFCIPLHVCAWILEENYERAYEEVRPQWVNTNANHKQAREIRDDQHIVAVMNDIENKHWIVIFANPGGWGDTFIVDSLYVFGAGHAYHSEFARTKAIPRLTKFLNQEERLTVNPEVPQQTDSSSCGLFVMRQLLFCAEQECPATTCSVVFEQQDIDMWRQNWMREWRRIEKEGATHVEEDTLKRLLMEDATHVHPDTLTRRLEEKARRTRVFEEKARLRRLAEEAKRQALMEEEARL